MEELKLELAISGKGAVVKVRIVEVASAKRNPLAPSVPTTNEVGPPNHYSGTWYVLLWPARLAKEIVDRINGETRKALADPEFNAGLLKIGAIGQCYRRAGSVH